MCIYEKLMIDPCDQIDCNGTLAICEVVFSTGQPKCTCPRGMFGDPHEKCEPDGNDFTKYNFYGCSNTSVYDKKDSLSTALIACREDSNAQ